MVHLDLTTDKTKFKALIHAAPTVADLDGDGRSEVIVGTSLGLLYVLDGKCLYKFLWRYYNALASSQGTPVSVDASSRCSFMRFRCRFVFDESFMCDWYL